MRFFIVISLLGLISMTAVAQEKQTEHTVKLSAGQKSPAATLAEMDWLAGHWTGNAFGGVSEEIWAKPAGGAMMGMFRQINNGKAVFYELMTLIEESGSIVMRLKHFNPNLTGWEEKDKTVDFKFVGKKDGVFHFEGMAFRPEGKDAVTIYVAMRQKDGSVHEEAFRYKRVEK